MKKKHDILKKEGGTLMRFYKNQHQFYIEIDLHARNMYACVINNLGEKVFHKNMTCSVDNLEIITNTFGNDIVIGVECIFTWYWIANFCAERNIEFALGHALYMAAIYKGKTKSDKIDSEKIANMLRGGFFLWLMHIQNKIEIQLVKSFQIQQLLIWLIQIYIFMINII